MRGKGRTVSRARFVNFPLPRLRSWPDFCTVKGIGQVIRNLAAQHKKSAIRHCNYTVINSIPAVALLWFSGVYAGVSGAGPEPALYAKASGAGKSARRIPSTPNPMKNGFRPTGR